MDEKIPCVYTLTNRPGGTIYVGVTSNLQARIWQHQTKVADGFSCKYNLDRLVWYEVHNTFESAIGREKNLKNWKRLWKAELIEVRNRRWLDLSHELF